ncbi:MAG: AI-2E family transporter [Chloroflexota bacterium]|nr:MAG: AI-2E family transporter [Chloroflexota bacterium]
MPRLNAKSTSLDWQRALFIPLTVLAWLVVMVIGLWLLSHILKTILTLVLSGIVAFALTPLVTFLARWMPRPLAIACAYVVGFAVIFGAGALVVSTAVAQVTNLVHALPSYAHRVQHLEPQLVRVLGPFGLTRTKFHDAQTQSIAYLQNIGTSTAKDSVAIITGIVGTIIDIVLVLILSIYLTSNGPKLTAWLRRETPGAQRVQTTLLIAIVNQVVGGYIRGTLTLASLVGVLVGGGMLALGVPYAVLLGVLAFFMEFIPIVGVLVSGSVCILLALFQGGAIKALIVLAYFVFVHVIEGDVVGPRIMGRAVGIHPATAIIALVAGTELFGVWGALFGAPLAGLIQAFATVAYRQLRGADPKEVLEAVVEQAKTQEEDEPLSLGEKEDSGAKPVSRENYAEGRSSR